MENVNNNKNNVDVTKPMPAPRVDGIPEKKKDIDEVRHPEEQMFDPKTKLPKLPKIEKDLNGSPDDQKI